MLVNMNGVEVHTLPLCIVKCILLHTPLNRSGVSIGGWLVGLHSFCWSARYALMKQFALSVTFAWCLINFERCMFGMTQMFWRSLLSERSDDDYFYGKLSVAYKLKLEMELSWVFCCCCCCCNCLIANALGDNKCNCLISNALLNSKCITW